MRVSDRLMKALLATAAVLVVCTLFLLGAGFYLYRLSLTLPDFRGTTATYDTSRTSVVYAADGSVLAEWHGEQDRTIVTMDAIPQVMRDAVVAIEDERFYEHGGVDLQSVIRSARSSGDGEQVRQGRSTITQQLVKLLFTDGERTVARKLREMLLAYQLESEADKDRVLEAYLNVVYFGHGAYGVESAARRHFGKPASELDLAEAALLAGAIRAPGRYSPVSDPEVARERRDTVIRKMRDLGLVSAGEAREALDADIELTPPVDAAVRAPYFVEWVKRDLVERLGSEAVYTGGLRVHTTIDPVVQKSAEDAVGEFLGGETDPETALVTLQPSTGRVLAMVGGRDFEADQYNLAAQGRRQPGSAFKTFVLVRALEEGISPDAVYAATPYSVEVEDGTWNVQNYENDATSPRLTLRAATNWSVNAVYARLIIQVGAEDVVDTARRMGIVSPLEPNPAIALGGLEHGVTPLEMASAYGTIASGGLYAAPRGVDRVLDDRGELIWEPGDEPVRALEEPIARRAAEMLHEVVTGGTGTEADFGQWAAGKTGTTQSYRDAWFVGWAEDLSTAVWVGHREGQIDMTNVRGIQVTGGSFPARIWRVHMARIFGVPRAVAPREPLSLGDSGDGVLAPICEESMLIARESCPSVAQLLFDAGQVPAEECGLHIE